MKMKMKKLLVSAMLLAMVLGSAGCGLERPAEGGSVYVRTATHVYDEAGEMIESGQYRYDSQGNFLSVSKDLGYGGEYFDQEQGIWQIKAGPVDGEMDKIDEFEYDDFGNRTLMKSWSADIEYQKAYAWAYEDKAGVTVPVKCEGSEDAYSFDYDQKGKLSSVTYTLEGEEKGKMRLSYDEADRLVRQEMDTREGKFIYEFTYNQGNQVETFTVSGDREDKLTFEYTEI